VSIERCKKIKLANNIMFIEAIGFREIGRDNFLKIANYSLGR